MAKCKLISDHEFQPIRGGKRERCAKCSTEYPCAHACKHVDCMADRGEPMPEHITYHSPVAVTVAEPEPAPESADDGSVCDVCHGDDTCTCTPEEDTEGAYG